MSTDEKPEPAAVIRQLREQALSIDAATLGLAATPERRHVFAVLMETGYAEAAVTLVALGDGSTSLYFSNGGGVIGAGEHAEVREANARFLDAAESFHAEFIPTDATPLPVAGRVRFYVRTFTGTLTAEAGEVELGEQRHGLSPLFHSGHAVITAIRHSTSH